MSCFTEVYAPLSHFMLTPLDPCFPEIGLFIVQQRIILIIRQHDSGFSMKGSTAMRTTAEIGKMENGLVEH
ncbi:hypothetical protein DSECCO2_609130 [anaerobic digester metagenome]